LLADTPAIEALFACDLAHAADFQPRFELDEGPGRFVAWFRTDY
jgi:UDP-glucuronate 4-epimerase